MWKWIQRLDRLLRFLAGVAKVVFAIIEALDPKNDHENPVDKEINNRPNSELR